MTFEKAIAALQIDLLAAEERNEALKLVLGESIRMRAALRYYADPKNWLDDVPMLNTFAYADEGHTAREALRLNDYIGVATMAPAKPEEGMNAG